MIQDIGTLNDDDDDDDDDDDYRNKNVWTQVNGQESISLLNIK